MFSMDYDLRIFCLYSFRSDRIFVDYNRNANIYNLFQLSENFGMKYYNYRSDIHLKKSSLLRKLVTFITSKETKNVFSCYLLEIDSFSDLEPWSKLSV